MRELNLSPADTYFVVNKSILDNNDRTIITLLYQPIIGSLPAMLYFSLWADLDKSEIMSTELTHNHLSINMQISLPELQEARKKLEAIGLLKTYYKEEQTNIYIYELYSPIKANDFFNHPILNVVLYNNTGKKEYEKLKGYFKMPKINTSIYEDVTASFTDVFSSIPLNSNALLEKDMRKKTTRNLNLYENFDFEILEKSLPHSLDKDKIFTKEIKELIVQLSFLYQLDVTKIQDIIPICITERGTINKEELRKTCRNYYQFDNNGSLPTIIYNANSNYSNSTTKSMSKREKMIYTFETINPYELLKSKNNGSEPTTRDLKLAEDLIIKYGLNYGVVNVLLDYILKTQNNKLNRSYAETIAGQWQRSKIETVEEAMNLAEKEYNKKNKKTSTPTMNRKVIKEEKIPEWFDKKIEKTEATKEEQDEMQTLLNKYS